MIKEKFNNETFNTLDEIDSDNSSKNEENIIIKRRTMKIKVLICLKKYLYKFLTKIKTCFSELSILSQHLVFILFWSFVILMIISTIHYHAFENLLKFNIYWVIRSEYLNFITSELDDIHFEIGSSQIKTSFEEYEDLFFFKLYYKELISMGLLNESLKIYPDISKNSEKLYQGLDLYLKNIKMNSIFTIPKKEAEKFIDKRNDSFSEFAKLYYHLFPIITFEAYNRNIYINQSFLIIYEFDNDTKTINNDYLYFSFPKSNNEVGELKNFEVFNNYIWPAITTKNELNQKNKSDNFYFKENWFINQDYDFRIEANKINNTKLLVEHLNYNYYGKVNKSNIFCLQNYENVNKKNYIFNYIFFVHQGEFKEDCFDYSTFIVFNENCSLNIKEKERYSDNATFLVFKSNIIEMSLSSTLTNYFHYGMYDKNNNFFKYGASFDGFDIDNLAEPLKYYSTTYNFNIDLTYFSSLYLYTKLFLNSNYNESVNENTLISQYNFEDRDNYTQNICEEYDFSEYKQFLEDEEINCWNTQNLQYNSQIKIPETKGLYNYVYLPYCICLPLYCLKNSKKDFDENNIEFVGRISLPDRCQNYLKYFENNVDAKTKNVIKTQEIMNFFSKHLNDRLEDEFYLYKYKKFSYIPGLYFLIINFVDNSILKNLLERFLDELTLLQFYTTFIITIGYIILIFGITYLLITNIKKLSKVIFDYKKKFEYFLYQSTLNNDNYNNELKNEIGLSNSYSTNRLDNVFSLSDNTPLLKKDNQIFEDFDIFNNEFVNSSGNQLLDDLFKLFNNYYNISIEKYLEIFKSQISNSITHKDKIYLMKDKNELFRLLTILSIYAPKFKLNVSMDFNFYVKSKLNDNFINSMAKEKHLPPQQLSLTQSVIYELLTTENVDDYGIVYNLYFKYITNINLRAKKNNSIKRSMFRYDENNEEDNYLNYYNKIIIYNNNTKIVYKGRNHLVDELEKCVENDDFFKKEKIKSLFDFFLINIYYKYIKKISFTEP